MQFGTVIGTIWATRRHPFTEGLSWRLVRPEDAAGRETGEPIVAADTVGAGPGERVFYVTAREAVIPLDAAEAPVDASIVGIVEGISERGGPGEKGSP